MPATPPVGSGFRTPEVRLKPSPFWNDARILETGLSGLFQVKLVNQRASNLESDDSTLAPTRAGSSEKTRIESVDETSVLKPANSGRPSLGMPRLPEIMVATVTPSVPTLPRSRAMA